MRDNSVVNLRDLNKAPSEPPRAAPPPQQPDRKRTGLLVPAALVFLLFLGVGAYFWFFRHTDIPAAPAAAASAESTNAETVAESAQVIAEVGKLIVLPEGEEPTVATVTDPKKLESQAFFANAKKGDKVLIYTKAKKAYLYDPTLHKLVEVAPIVTELQ